MSALTYHQDYKNEINHKPIKWEDLKYDHMSHKLWGDFPTYMGKYENNKPRDNTPWGREIASNKAVMGRKVASTTTSNKYFSQGRSNNNTYLFLKTFRPAEKNLHQTKISEDAGYFIHF